jgi:hypothetical protein
MATSKADKSPLLEDKYGGIILCFCEPTGSHKKSPFFYRTLENANVTERETGMYFPISERRKRRTMVVMEPSMDFYFSQKSREVSC